MTTTAPLWRRCFAELIGTAMLAVAVVGSGIAAQRLSPTEAGLQLAINAAATGLALLVIILILGVISGAHINPAVTLTAVILGGHRRRDAATYLPAQLAGAILGVVTANLIFSEPAVALSTNDRLTAATFSSEVIATTGLILVIFTLIRTGRSRYVPAAVGAYIAAAYFVTSSTGFANPALTIARALSHTLSGIAPGSVPGFIGAQLLGAGLGYLALRLLIPATTLTSENGTEHRSH